MTDRQSLRATFLNMAGWGEAEVVDLAGDASNRRYFRLTMGDTSAVLMDAPPETGETVAPFVQIAGILRAASLSAPEIIAEDMKLGFLLLEDLGDDLFARVLEKTPYKEQELYTAAIDVLIALHQAPASVDLVVYDPNIMANLAGLAFDWYAQGVTGESTKELISQFTDRFAAQLLQIDGLQDVLIQRDYHSENLLWLPSRSGVARVGLLDFQDAMAGHRAYDLVSLLQDARRDVGPGIERQMLDRYISETCVDRSEFEAAYALLGLQRNLRIIGVFARLCIRDSKPYYIDLIPRVWEHMLCDLEWADLGNLETDFMNGLPPPDTTTLNILRSKCGTILPQ